MIVRCRVLGSFKNQGVLLAGWLLQEVSQHILMIICNSTKHCNAFEGPVV